MGSIPKMVHPYIKVKSYYWVKNLLFFSSTIFICTQKQIWKDNNHISEQESKKL